MDVFDLAAKLTLDKSEYEQGLDDAEKSGNGLGDRLKGAFGTAAKAGAALGAAGVAAGAAIYGVATKSAQASDRVDKMSQKLGLSRTAFQELDFVASQSGTSVEGLRGGMRTLVRQMTSAATGTGKSADAFKKLGVSVTDANGEMKSQEDIFFETVSALQNMEDGTEKASLATQLLGRSGTELMPLLNGAAGSMDSMRQQAHDLGLVLSDETIDAGVKFTDTVDQVQRAFSAIIVQIGGDLMPIIQNALEFVLAHLPEIQSVMSTVFNVLQGFVTTFVDIVTNTIMPILEDLISFVTNIFAGDWKAAWDDIRGLFERVWDGITDWFWGVFDSVKNTITTIDWASVGSSIVGFIQDAFASVVEWFTNLYTDAANAIKDIDWTAVGSAIWDFIKGAFDNVVSFFTSLFGGEDENGVVGSVKSIDWAGLGKAILDFIVSAFNAAVDLFKGIFFGNGEEDESGVYGAIKSIDWLGLGKAILDAIITGLGNIVEGFKALFEGEDGEGGAVGAIKSIDWVGLGAAIFDFIKSAFDTIADTFKTIFAGEDGEGGVIEAVKEIDWLGLGKAILNFIKEAFIGIGEIFKGFFFGSGEDDTEGVYGAIKSIDWLGLGKAILKGITGAFDGISDIFSEIFGGENGEGGVVGAIKSALGGLGTWFADLFTFDIKLPHFSVNWSDYGFVSIPSISVEWYAKAGQQPYMFSNATLFGAGERGDEILYGRDNLMRDIREATAKNSGNWNVTFNITQQPGEDVNRLADVIAERLEFLYKQEGSAYGIA